MIIKIRARKVQSRHSPAQRTPFVKTSLLKYKYLRVFLSELIYRPILGKHSPNDRLNCQKPGQRHTNGGTRPCFHPFNCRLSHCCICTSFRQACASRVSLDRPSSSAPGHALRSAGSFSALPWMLFYLGDSLLSLLPLVTASVELRGCCACVGWG